MNNCFNYDFKFKIWIDSNNDTFLGHGRIKLLEKIKELGSISKAAKSLGMSYKRAWDIIDSINKQSEKPLVVTNTGGKGGGGAKISKEGEKAIVMYWYIYGKMQDFINKETKNIDIFGE